MQAILSQRQRSTGQFIPTNYRRDFHRQIYSTKQHEEEHANFETGAASQLAEKYRTSSFISGHDLGRAATASK
jgi:hypothetical protein